MINFTQSGQLHCTLTVCDPVITGGVVSPEDTTDHEEKEQCIKMHEIINQYNLDGEFRYDSFTRMSCQAICLMHEIINPYNLDGEFRYDSFTHMSCQAICLSE